MREARRRLSGRELGIIKFLFRHQAAGLRRVALGRQLRALALPLWREGLVEVWYRQVPDEQPSLRGPHFSLTHAGRRLGTVLAAKDVTKRGHRS